MPLEPRYREILDLARPYLDTRSNLEHTEGSLRFARLLLEREGGDPDVVIPGVILHDVGWSQVSEEGQLQAFGPKPTRPDLNRLHEERGAEIAAEILAQVGWDPPLIAEIAEIVRGHDSQLTSTSLNDSLVKDADKLFRLTRRGYYIFWEWFPLDFRQYLGTMAERAGEWFFTATAKRLRDEMFADLEVYVSELEAAAANVDSAHAVAITSSDATAHPAATTPGQAPPARAAHEAADQGGPPPPQTARATEERGGRQ